MKTFAIFLGIATIGLLVARADDKVIVHEWGTFTSLQDERGEAIGGINVDDEPVPSFVWQYATATVQAQYSTEWGNLGLPPYRADSGKGWITGDPTVTMRLETPVIYIYPPKGQSPQSVPPLDVHVDFHGGVLSQYYPYAQTNGATKSDDITYLDHDHSRITEDTTTGLTWKGVQLGAEDKALPTTDKELLNAPFLRGEMVKTDDQVWTTPRDVSAPLLGVKFSMKDYAHPGARHECAQTEHFLFYRGVGHLESPLLLKMPFVTGIHLDSEEAGLEIAPRNEADEIASHAVYDQVWIVKILSNGACGFHTLTGVTNVIPNSVFRPINAIDSSFGAGNSPCSLDNLTKLKASMRDALVKEGLYDDEATAMLKTWELSYFKSPGLRFFYIVPRTWTDKVLPLKITGAPTEITRVMVGRIELITDAQKAALARLDEGPCPDLPAFKKQVSELLEKHPLAKKDEAALYEGRKPLADLGLTVPPLIKDYLGLGRFRDALVVDKFHHMISAPELVRFINDNHLTPEPVPESRADKVQLSPDVSLKNPGKPRTDALHL